MLGCSLSLCEFVFFVIFKLTHKDYIPTKDWNEGFRNYFCNSFFNSIFIIHFSITHRLAQTVIEKESGWWKRITKIDFQAFLPTLWRRREAANISGELRDSRLHNVLEGLKSILRHRQALIIICNHFSFKKLTNEKYKITNYAKTCAWR